MATIKLEREPHIPHYLSTNEDLLRKLEDIIEQCTTNILTNVHRILDSKIEMALLPLANKIQN